MADSGQKISQDGQFPEQLPRGFLQPARNILNEREQNGRLKRLFKTDVRKQ